MARVAVQRIHRAAHLLHHGSAGIGGGTCLAGHLARFGGLGVRVGHACGQCLHAAGGGIERAGLLLGTRRQGLVVFGDLLAGRGDLLCAGLDTRQHAGKLVAHAGHVVQHAAVVRRAQGDGGGQVTGGNAPRNLGGVARLAAKLGTQAARRDPRQRRRRQQAGAEQGGHPCLRAQLAGRHAGHRGRGLLFLLPAHGFHLPAEGLQLFGDEVAVDRDRAVELQRVQRLLAQQRHVGVHQLAGALAFAQQRRGLCRGGLAYAGQRSIELRQAARDVGGGIVALGAAGGHGQRQLGTAKGNQRRLRTLGRDGAVHVVLVQGIGARLDRDQVGDAGQPDGGAEQVHQGKGGTHARHQRQAAQSCGKPREQPRGGSCPAAAGQACLDDLQHGEDSKRARWLQKDARPGLDPNCRARCPLSGTVAGGARMVGHQRDACVTWNEDLCHHAVISMSCNGARPSCSTPGFPP
ncbi:hypothetical protein D9M72_321290 [compost metagenome]